jgi:hypothetical protein
MYYSIVSSVLGLGFYAVDIWYANRNVTYYLIFLPIENYTNYLK